MIFPDKYTVLRKNKYVKGNFSLVPIRYRDRFSIMKWRNEQIYHLRQNKLLTEEVQEDYFRHVVLGLFGQQEPEQILFSYLDEDVCIGYGGIVHINWIDRNAEISFVIDSSLEIEGFHRHWSIFLDLIEQVAFDVLKFHKLFTYAFDLRPRLYEAVEAKGYRKEAVLKEHILFNHEYRDVVIHSKIVADLYLRNAIEEDCKIFFEWVNNISVRRNSFHPDMIEWEDHVEWFKNKMKSDRTKLYVLMSGNHPVGQVRLDKDGGYWIVDYSIDEKYRGLGWGKRLISLLLDVNIRPLKAFVKINNESSIRSFKNNSFSMESGVIDGAEVYVFYKL